MVLAMHMRNAICLSLLAAFVAGLSWVLGLLSKSMEFSSFMIFCVVTFALMVTAGYAYDYFDTRSRQ
jgi:hypothetical protein